MRISDWSSDVCSSDLILLFLHADSRFPAGGLGRIEETLAAAPEIGGGNFRLLFDGGDGFSRWLDGFYAFIRRRSEERRVGKACVRTCSSQWSTYHSKTNTIAHTYKHDTVRQRK